MDNNHLVAMDSQHKVLGLSLGQQRLMLQQVMLSSTFEQESLLEEVVREEAVYKCHARCSWRFHTFLLSSVPPSKSVYSHAPR